LLFVCNGEVADAEAVGLDHDDGTFGQLGFHARQDF